MIIDTDEWFSLAEIAEEYGMAKKTASRAAKRAGLEPLEFAGLHLYHVDQIPALVAHYYPRGSEIESENARRFGRKAALTRWARHRERVAANGTTGTEGEGSPENQNPPEPSP